jgi:predicted RNA methylase
LLNIYTTPAQAVQINNVIKKYITYDSVVTDATACIGGNTIYFEKDFKVVIAIEKDPDIFQILKRNTTTSVKYNCSYNDIMYTIQQDLIFIDPPWGGSNYKKEDKVLLMLDDVNVLDIIDNLYHFTRFVALKVPNNFDTKSLTGNFWDHTIHTIYTFKKNNYKLIIFHKKI